MVATRTWPNRTALSCNVQDFFKLGYKQVSGWRHQRHYFETLLNSPMFKIANLESPAKEDHGIKLWLLHNIVWYFIVKKGLADLTNLYAGKQDGRIINKIFQPKEDAAGPQPQQSGVRGASGLIVDAPTLVGLANASSTGRSIRQGPSQQATIAQQVQEIIERKEKKGPMLEGEYGVAPWSTQVKVLPQTPASHNVSSGEENTAAATMELPFCAFNLEDSYEVRVARPFCPFESRKEVPIQSCEELKDAVPPKHLLILGSNMPEHLDWEQNKVDTG
ncbi:hypothetical protein KFL_011080010, partial [Klebsormidium nitens]